MIGFKSRTEKTEEESKSETPTKEVEGVHEEKEGEDKISDALKKFEVTDSDRDDYHNLVDILFVIDTTSSMGWCFLEAKRTIINISQMFTKQEFDMRFAICEYRDHPPQDNTFVYQHYDLQNADKMSKIVDTLAAHGGGDGPEAVMDGLYKGITLTKWRSDEDGTQSKRFLFHIADAPPHGSEYGGHSADANWRNNGCPCKITRHMIAEQIKEKKITYNLIECAGLDKTIQLFRESFGDNFQEIIKIDRNQVNGYCRDGCITLDSAREMKKSAGCCGSGGGYEGGHSYKSYEVSSKLESTGEAKESNIFSKQIESNVRRNLV